MDQKELDERVEKLDSIAKENPKHLIEYANACYEESETANADLRMCWDDTWSAYQNEVDYSDKEEWQTSISIARPFSTVQQAKSIIRKALTSSQNLFDFIADDDAPDDFIELLPAINSVMRAFHGDKGSKFDMNFMDALEMGIVTGQSMEMVPRWENDRLYWTLVEPWKIYRDPNAVPRDSQSGNYWIREEFLDYWYLKMLEDAGILENISDLKAQSGGDSTKKSKERYRKQQSYQRNKFINSLRVREFWGLIVDDKGELLIPNGTYMISNDKIIKPPIASPYQTLRWPGVSFSPIPHILRYEGKGLVENIIDLWHLLNNLLNLHFDNLNWLVNPPKELDIATLADPSDEEVFPGKLLLKRSGMQGVPSLTPMLSTAASQEILLNAQYLEKLWQNTSFVSEFLEGLPGSRTDITKGEVEMKTEMGMGVFHSIAKDLEFGAVSAIWTAYEIIAYNLTNDNKLFRSAVTKYGDQTAKTILGFKELLPEYAYVKVSGITNLIQRFETLKRIEAAMMKAESPAFNRYLRPYNLIKAYFDILQLNRYDALVNPDEAQQVGATAQTMAQAAELMNPELTQSAKVPGGNTGTMRNTSMNEGS